MLKSYFTAVNELMPWDQIDEDEIDECVKACRFVVLENYSPSDRFPGVDVLFVLCGQVQYYQVFTVENSTLKELHQEHQPEFCLTCDERAAELQQGPF